MIAGIVDKTDHSPAAGKRPKRTATSMIVLHRTINVDADRDGDRDFDDVLRFFTRDPEGVATVTIGKRYAELLPIIKEWRAKGIPAAYQGRGFSPYHFLVDARGGVAQALPIDAVGAHAGRKANLVSVAVAVVGDPRTEQPTKAMIAACVDVVAALLARYPGCEVIDHDEVNRRHGYLAKECIGGLFPLAEVATAARAKVGA